MNPNEPTLPPELLEPLKRRYAEPHRHYHTLAHIEALLGWLQQYRPLAAHPQDIEAAIWFHDAVYDTRRSDNELLSAEMARQALTTLGWAPARVERVVSMVQATQHHQAAGNDPDTWLFLDLDLSVLAARPEHYRAYSLAIRAEFGWVPEADYRIGRSRVLSGFLKRPQIYWTPELQARWEKAARANVEQELSALQAA